MPETAWGPVRRETAFALVAWTLVATGLGAANEAPPQEEGVVVPPTFYETATVEARPVSDSTAAVTVVDRSRIEASAARTAADVLRLVPGLVVETDGTRGGLTVVRLRGGDPNFTRILVDGVPVNDPTSQVGDVFNLEGLAAEALERIEVVRGPLSSFYGSTGLAGAVNLITRGGESTEPSGRAGAVVGEASLRAAGGSLKGGAGRVGLSGGGWWEEENGRIGEESFRSGRAWFRAGSDQGARRAWTLAGDLGSWSARDYPDASGGPVLGDGALRSSDHEEARLVAGASASLRGWRQSLDLSVYRHDLDRRSPAVVPQVPESSETTRFTRLRGQWRAVRDLGRGVRLGLGADLEQERARNESLLLLPPFLGGPVRGDYRIDRLLAGVFGELAWERGPWLLEVGARVDDPDNESVRLSPRVGIGRRLGDGNHRVRGSWGQAFKLPSYFALASPPELGGNPALAPETSTGVEVAWEARLARGEAGVGVFRQTYRELIDFDFDTFSHVNRSEVEATGVEAWSAWRPTTRTDLSLQVTWQDVENVGDPAPLRGRPEWSGGGQWRWRATSTVSIVLDANALSAQRDRQIPVPDRDRVEGHAVTGLTVDWRPEGRWTVRLRLENLLDEEYENRIGFPGAARSARLAVGWRTIGAGRPEP